MRVFSRSEDFHWEYPERDSYPMFIGLIHGYFHQDYDIISEHPEEVLAQAKRETDVEDSELIAKEICKFLVAFGENDRILSESFTRIVDPEVDFEGWEGKTTREWLLRMIEVFSA